MKETKQFKYEDAIHELEGIVDSMENGEMDIDSMTAKLKRAQELIKLCKDRLTKTDAELKKILDGDKQ